MLPHVQINKSIKIKRNYRRLHSNKFRRFFLFPFDINCIKRVEFIADENNEEESKAMKKERKKIKLEKKKIDLIKYLRRYWWLV